MVENFFDRQTSPAQAGLGGLVILGLCPLLAPASNTAGSIDPAMPREAIVSTLTRGDNDKTIEVQVGDSIVVRLAENPTTGFTWAIDKAGDDVLRLETSEYSPAADAGVGGGGQRSLTFKATKAGTVKLQLKLWREWEGDKSIAERFAATVRVIRGAAPGKARKL
jgi:inhibitor of cysteine peptidase